MALIKDPGLQPERTVLAWSRTGLLLAANALLLLRASGQMADKALLLLGVLLIGCSVWVALVARARARELAEPVPAQASAVQLATVSAATVIASGGALWLFVR